MRYAELAFVDRSDERVRVLVRFEDTDERDAAAVDFARFYGLEGAFRDITYREARSLYDLRRFDRPRYRVEVTVAGERDGETREIPGIYATAYEQELQRRAVLRASGETRLFRPGLTLDQILEEIES